MEVELKFAVDPADHGRLRRARALLGIRPRRELLDTTYFDTPDCQLAGHDLALRLRRIGDRWIEGLKSRQLGAGGLHVREEWEYERLDAGIDLARFADSPLAALPDPASLHRRLRPAFRVVMHRTTWRLSPSKDTRLEVALDHGEVRCGGRAAAISEVEIECLEGDAGAAFALAARLLADLPLRPSAVSKAERGYRLFRREAAAPSRAGAVHLDADDTIETAARRVAAAGLRQLQANEEGVIGSTDPEYVHQARIALRRLRSGLRMFRTAIGVERSRDWRDELAKVARRLGAARDWDVFAASTLPPLLADFGNVRLARTLRERVARRRRDARAGARRALADPRYAATLLAIARWLASPEEAPRARGSLGRFARDLLRRRHRRVDRDLARIGSLDAEGRHRLRIAAKRLRYGTDAMAALLEPARVAEYLEVLAELQDTLGAANDAATAARLARELPLPRSFARYAATRLREDSAADAAKLRRLLRRLHAARAWR